MPLRILALDASVAAGSVAALVGNDLIAERLLDATSKTARTLAPAMAEVIRAAGWRPRDVELVAVGIGPGSFTGLRIAVTAAKTFAYALGCPLLGVGTLRAIAAQAPEGAAEIHAVLDAQRSELFVQRFSRGAGGLPTLVALDEPAISTLPAWLASLATISGTTPCVTGPGLARHLAAVRTISGITLADAALWPPRAATLGRLAHHDHLAGRHDDPLTLAPIYLRLSYAEEKK